MLRCLEEMAVVWKCRGNVMKESLECDVGGVGHHSLKGEVSKL